MTEPRISRDWGLPTLTEEQLREFAEQHINHGVAYVKYEGGKATVLKYEDIYLPIDALRRGCSGE